MKIRIERPFRDRYSGIFYQVGQIVDCSERRLKEIQSVSCSLVSVVTDDEEDQKPVTKRTRKRKTQ
jgi:hypothetical protein